MDESQSTHIHKYTSWHELGKNHHFHPCNILCDWWQGFDRNVKNLWDSQGGVLKILDYANL
jgi:hypothetical protein